MAKRSRRKKKRRVATRIKKMPLKQFEQVMDRSWTPVKLEGETIPDWLSGIPSTLIHSVYASGTHPPGLVYSDSAISSAELIGEVEVYRLAPDDPVDLNRDWYPIIRFSSSDTMLLVRGPISDSDHWLNTIPDNLMDVEILTVPPIYSNDSSSS